MAVKKLSYTIPFNFKARSYQREIWDARTKGYRYFVTVWHRRAGKDKFWINFTIEEMLKRVGTYFYILPTYKQAKQIVWNGIDRTGAAMLFSHVPPELLRARNETDLSFELENGSRFQLVGSDNIDRIVGTNPVGMVFSEFSLQRPAAWERMRPILAENQGWAAFNFTPRGENHAKKIWDYAQENPKTWFSSIRTVDQTVRDAPGEEGFGGPVTSPREIDEDRAQGMDEEVIQQEYFCSFTAPRAGAYYGKYMEEMVSEDRYTDVPWDPHTPVFTAWDLGISDATAIIFAQWYGEMLHIIDYIEVTSKGLNDTVPMVLNKSYAYSNHYAPHDIKQREMVSGRSRLEYAQNIGIPFRIVPNISIQDGIDSVRRMLPRVRIDRTRCARLYTHLKEYHKEYDEAAGIYKDSPVHDAHSHAADAARYLSLSFERERPENMREVIVSGLNDSPYQEYSVDQDGETW